MIQLLKLTGFIVLQVFLYLKNKKLYLKILSGISFLQT